MDFHDFFQNFRINDAAHKADRAEGTAKNANSQIEILHERIDSLSLAVMALGELLQDVGFSKEMIMNKIESIDLRDGKLDGKLSETRSCNGCGRTVAGRHVVCLYCGDPIQGSIFK